MWCCEHFSFLRSNKSYAISGLNTFSDLCLKWNGWNHSIRFWMNFFQMSKGWSSLCWRKEIFRIVRDGWYSLRLTKSVCENERKQKRERVISCNCSSKQVRRVRQYLVVSINTDRHSRVDHISLQLSIRFLGHCKCVCFSCRFDLFLSNCFRKAIMSSIINYLLYVLVVLCVIGLFERGLFTCWMIR